MPSSTIQTAHLNTCLEEVGANQDREAFADLVKHFAPLLKAFMLNAEGITTDQAEALVQETLVRVWQKAPDSQASQSSAKSFIFTIARNIRLNWQWQSPRIEPEYEVASDTAPRQSHQIEQEWLITDKLYATEVEPSSSGLITRQDSINQIEARLETLPDEQAEMLRLMFIEGKSIRQAADALDLPLAQVRSLIRSALQHLNLKSPPSIGNIM